MITRGDDPCADPRNADVIAFLRRGLTADERNWPRFVPTLRAVRDVSMGELRTHPDLVEELIALAPDREDARMLMGAPVLIARSGVMYATAFSMRVLMLRSPEVFDPRTVEPESRIEPVGPEWRAMNVWMMELTPEQRVAAKEALRRSVASARIAAEELLA